MRRSGRRGSRRNVLRSLSQSSLTRLESWLVVPLTCSALCASCLTSEEGVMAKSIDTEAPLTPYGLAQLEAAESRAAALEGALRALVARFVRLKPEYSQIFRHDETSD